MWIPLSDIIPTSLTRFGLNNLKSTRLIEENWPHIAQRILGKKIAQHTRAVSFSRKTLTIETSSAQVANEVHLRSLDIIVFIKKLNPDVDIDHIRIIAANGD